jgi:threonine synthase
MGSRILFKSTNRQAPQADFKEVLLRGQAPDYGLYMPLKIPLLKEKDILSFRDKNYSDIAYDVISGFVGEEIPSSYLKTMIKESYNFDVPLQKVNENLYLLWLTQGPTASFKDFAARLMARMMHFFAMQDDKRLMVLVATSGDTGSAIANAFHKIKNINVVILFPRDEVTEKQRKQMTTLGDNVFPVAVKGKFDDCQAMVKRAFNDPGLKHLCLTSANSINFGRLLPQTVYYFYAFSRLNIKDVVFCVPSGNFGNLMGGVFAKKMGLPVKKFIVGVNENDEFPEFLKTGIYTPVVPSKECSSNAMNVGHPSNLARLFDLYGGWLMDERDKDGNVVKSGITRLQPDMGAIRRDFWAYSVTEKEVDETIVNFYKDYGILIEPHGAVGLRASELSGSDSIVISLETADPAKFPEKIKNLLNREPELPPSIAGLDNIVEDFVCKENDYGDLKEFLLSRKT